MNFSGRVFVPPPERAHPYDQAPIGEMCCSGDWDPDAPDAEPAAMREPLSYPPADYLCLDCVLDRCRPRDHRCVRRADSRRSVETVDARTRLLVAIRDLSVTCEKVSGAALARYLQRSRCAVYLVLNPAIDDGLVVRHGHHLVLTEAGWSAVERVFSEKQTSCAPVVTAPPSATTSTVPTERIRISSIL